MKDVQFVTISSHHAHPILFDRLFNLWLFGANYVLPDSDRKKENFNLFFYPFLFSNEQLNYVLLFRSDYPIFDEICTDIQ